MKCEVLKLMKIILKLVNSVPSSTRTCFEQYFLLQVILLPYTHSNETVKNFDELVIKSLMNTVKNA